MFRKLFGGSITSTVMMIPILMIVVFSIGVQIGLSVLYSEQSYALDYQQDLAVQQTAAERIPGELSAIQSGLYKLAVISSIGVTGEEITKTKAQIDASFEQVIADIVIVEEEGTVGALHEEFMQFKKAVEQALTLIERSPVVGVTAVRGVAPIFQRIEAATDARLEQVTTRVGQEVQTLRERWQAMLLLVVAGSLVLMTCLSALSFCTSRLITNPILALSRTVKALGKNDVTVRVPGVDRRDELGLVARSIEQFRRNLIEMFALQKERDDLNQTLEEKVRRRTREVEEKSRELAASQQQVEANRLKMAAQLRKEFGAVVQAASAGDFTMRISRQFSDENLQALADDVNRMIASVDFGVSAAAKAVKQLAEEGAPAKPSAEFSGAIADMMRSIDETSKILRGQSDNLRHNALHDALTELPNRRYLEEYLQGMRHDLDSGAQALAVMHIDLDRFKEVNDTLGHAAGDKVLVRSAGILKAAAGTEDFLARVGGDEFVLVQVIASGLDGDVVAQQDVARAEKTASQIVKEMGKPFDFDGAEVRYGASVGIAFSSAKQSDPSQLLVEADIALYAAKEAGRNQPKLFTPELNSRILDRMKLGDDLRRGMDADEFVPFFQPQVHAETASVMGYEALVRWQHPSKGVLPPSEFLRTAEDIGLVSELDSRMAQKAVLAANRLQAKGHSFDKLALNVSIQHLDDPKFLEKIQQLKPSGYGLCVELLETIFFDEQTEPFLFTLDALREMDVEIAIDDFGSGRASISSLLKLRPDWIKIDQSIVRALGYRENQLTMVRAMVDMAHALDVRVLAEGVENTEVAQMLAETGCELLQGFAFGQPMSEDDLAPVPEQVGAKNNRTAR